MDRRVRRIVSGGQTGADLAALDFALRAGIDCGGWVPRGRTNEAGRIPAHYPNLAESDSEDPAVRTRLNVRDSDGTVVLSHGPLGGGSKLTAEVAAELGRPCLHLDLDDLSAAAAAAQLCEWLSACGIETLNVAGPRYSQDPRIYERTLVILELALA